MNLTEPTQAPASRILTILVVVVGLVAVVAVIVAAVSLSRPSSPNITIGGSTINPGGGSSGSGVQYVQSPQGGASGSSGKKVWMIHIGHDYGAHEYIDTKGYLAGFHHDLIAAVCEAAGIDCRTVWDTYSNCWDSSVGQHSHGGKGLLGRWYDACTGWYTTIDRVQVFSFSQPFLKPTQSYLYAKDSDFNFNDITGKKIGFVDGWASDEKCMARWKTLTGSELSPSNVVHVDTPDKLRDMIMSGAIAAGFAAATDMEPYDDNLTKSPSSHSCMINGNAMMTRKDNAFASYWNQGFMKLMSSGKFAKMCTAANENPDNAKRGKVDCVQS